MNLSNRFLLAGGYQIKVTKEHRSDLALAYHMNNDGDANRQ